jgi:FkbM family methyltransferase
MEYLDEKMLMNLITDCYLQSEKKFLLIEIGANDGVMGDKLHYFIKNNDPLTILIEPVNDYYKQLKKNYDGCKNITFLNVAIDTISGERDLYYIPQSRFDNHEVDFRVAYENIPNHWARGCGSFYDDKNNLACPELKRYSKVEKVKTLSFADLDGRFKFSNFKNLVIQTDCEGHDLEILKSFDFELIKPRIYISEISSNIRIPKSHPNYPFGDALYSDKQQLEAIEIFKQNGYEVYRCKNDMVAIDRFMVDKLQ